MVLSWNLENSSLNVNIDSNRLSTILAHCIGLINLDFAKLKANYKLITTLGFDGRIGTQS